MANLRPLAIAGATVAGVYGAYKGVEHLYEQHRIQRLEGRPSWDTDILPFTELFLTYAEMEGLEVESAGGIVKQALCDENTTYDLERREMYVSDDPNTRARKKATVYRPPTELTLRDNDNRVMRIFIPNEDGHTEEDGLMGRWMNATAELAPVVRERQARIQARIDADAQEIGFEQGPDVSLFPYEPDFSGQFKVSDYATRTRLVYVGGIPYEVLFDNNGNQLVVPVQESWTCVVRMQNGKELRIPTSAPVTILGRTLTRAIASRDRDMKEVYEAVDVLKEKGLYSQLLGQTWEEYVGYRKVLSRSLGLESMRRNLVQGKVGAVASLALAQLVLPFKGRIEGSFIGVAIRDPQLEISKIPARMMGAK